jgi:outer membrane autotransporter protein
MTCPVREGAAAFIKEGECLWARGSGRAFDQDATFQTFGFDETSWQFATGAQFALGPAWRIGGAFAYEHSNLETDTNAKTEGDRFDGGAVLKYNPGALLLAAGVSGGVGSYDVKRPISFPGFSALAKGDADIGSVDGRFRAAYLLTSGAWYAKPMVDFDVTWLGLDGTNEHGGEGAGLKVRGNDETVFSASPALEIGTQLVWSDGTLLRPYARAGATIFGDNDFVVLASFEQAPGGVGPFRIATKTDDVVADVGAGLDIIGKKGAELKLFYEGRFGDLVSDNAGGVKASIPF